MEEKKFLATLLILCSVVAATSFGSEAKLEPSFQWLVFNSSRAELKASYPAKCDQMILTLYVTCRRGKGVAQNVADKTYSVSTAYSKNSSSANIKKGDIVRVDYRLTILINGQTLIM